MDKKVRFGGGYREFASFQTATLIYDATLGFCEKFLDPRGRTGDPMVRAARLARLNIADVSRAANSAEDELHLVNVARARMEELLLDYEDYLRLRRLPRWESDGPEALAVRAIARNKRGDSTASADPSDSSDSLERLTTVERWQLYARWLEHSDGAIRANALICLIHQANYLLDRKIAAVERALFDKGGDSERPEPGHLDDRRPDPARPTGPSEPASQPLSASRAIPPNPNKSPGPSNPSLPSNSPKAATPPTCPQCGSLMALRTAKTGKGAGQSFWGCTQYPTCTGSIRA